MTTEELAVQDRDHLPENVFSNGRGPWTPEKVRALANVAANDLMMAGGGFGNGDAIREALSPGEEAWDVFSRTEVRDEDEARFFAVQYALAAPRLRNNEAWKDAPWVNMPPIACAMYLENVFMMSLHRQARKEAIMVGVQMLMDVWDKMASHRRNKKEA